MKKNMKLNGNSKNLGENKTIKSSEKQVDTKIGEVPLETIEISKDFEKNKYILEEKLGIKESFDIFTRNMNFHNKKITLYFVNGLVDSAIMTQILKQLANTDRDEFVPNTLKKLLETCISHIQVELVNTINKSCNSILSGQLIMFIEKEDKAILIDVRNYPGRNPEEPDTERVVRGARDGYTETLLMNTSLTRRRIRDERLRMEILQIGERSKSDICIAYLKDVADPGLVNIIKQKLKEIKIDGLPMAEKTIEEFIIGKTWNPFPLVRYTERPDVASAHILEGHVIIFADTSPSVIILPTTYFHHLQHAEEYRQTPVMGTYYRWIRFIGVFISIFILPLWFLYVIEPDLIPEAISFIGPRDTSRIPIFFQFLIGEIGLDLMRMAAVHTPTPLATAMGLIAAVLIGDIAIKVGWFVPEVILYLAAAVLGMYSTPSYELSLANKLVRLLLLFSVYLFKVPGFFFGTTIIIIVLASTRSLNTPYLWPFIPFNLQGFIGVLVRKSIPTMNRRPSIVHPQNQSRQ
ncbi:MAG: spore germination protein [Vulcanibacillus sp.]